MRATILVFSLLAFPASAAFDFRVIDGDTVNVPTGVVKHIPKRISIRLVGINAPETSRAKCAQERELGEAAKLYLRDRMDKATKIKVEFVRWDKYGGRVAGRITVDGKDLGSEMVKAGLAVPYNKGPRVNVWCSAVGNARGPA